MFSTPAYAQAAGGSAGAGGLGALIPFILIFVVFYFLLIRPQQKKMKEHRTMLEALRRGDRIVTGGGIIGQITRVDDVELQVEIAEGVRVKVKRDMVAGVTAKTEPVANDDGKDRSGDGGEGKGRREGRRRRDRSAASSVASDKAEAPSEDTAKAGAEPAESGSDEADAKDKDRT